jgi:predicted PurR-regulated permease PerM
MAFFLTLLLLPMFRWMYNKGLPEWLSILLAMTVLATAIAGIVFFLSYQIGNLTKDLPVIKKNINDHWAHLSAWIEKKFHISSQEQMAAITKQTKSMSKNLGTTVVTLSGLVVFVGLLPIYVFLILFYRNLLVRFVFLWFEEPSHEKVEAALRETEVIVKYYLIGLLIQITYLTVLVGGVLLLFGIKHAILIGVIFAILNLIPYVGALIGNVIGVVLTLTSSPDMQQIFIVLGTIAAVQFLDNNILMPRIVGSKVKINALASIVGIIIGGTMAGISGMFLSIPLLAVMKIVFDKSPIFRQWGTLLGDARPGVSPMTNPVVRMKNKKLQEEKETGIPATSPDTGNEDPGSESEEIMREQKTKNRE